MADDFVKKAFADAQERMEDKEFEEFRKRIIEGIDHISLACGIAVGLNKMEKLSASVIRSDSQQTFADWTRMVMTIAFSEGYKAGMESE